MFITTSKDKTIEVLGQERRRRWNVEEKLTMVSESLEPGQCVSVVVWRNGINPNQLFHWRKLYQDGSLSAVSDSEAVVPASELADRLHAAGFAFDRDSGDKSVRDPADCDRGYEPLPCDPFD